MDRQPSAAARPILTAEVLSIGSELTTGETADTNAGELARSLTDSGVRVERLTALPDRRDDVEGAFRAGLERADLIVSTGGLGPTPDDLTRESIAAVCAETPSVDAGLERWLRGLWERRGMPFAEINLKQAWLIPSARALPNPNGTAPGWWVDRPDGRVVVLLPGPPREMRPMWRDEALPSLRERGLGSEQAVRTLRLAGIGESAVAERLGETILRATNPVVATYARAEAVDVRLSAVGRPALDGVPARSADELLDEVEPVVLGAVGAYVWARGGTTWAEAVGAALDARGWSLATSRPPPADRSCRCSGRGSGSSGARRSARRPGRAARPSWLGPQRGSGPRRERRSAWRSQSASGVPTPRSRWPSPPPTGSPGAGAWPFSAGIRAGSDRP